MVAFRKLFPVLAIVALLLGTAVMASAQVATGTPLRCTANAGVPPIVRAEGYTELTGDLVVECTGGDPTKKFTANFQLFLNTNITSRLVGSDNMTEALLMIDEPGLARTNVRGEAGAPTPFCVSPSPASNSTEIDTNGLTSGTTGGTGTVQTCNEYTVDNTYQEGYYTIFRGTRGNQPNQTVGGVPVGNENLIVWQGIPVTPPGSNRTRTFRITNIRANAAGLGASQTLIPTQIVAYISVFPQNTLPIDNPQQTVGYVQQGMLFDVRACNGTDGLSTPVNQNQCQTQNGDWFSDPTRSSAFSAQFGLRFREGFQTAFKPRIIGGAEGTGQATSLPGQVFNSESGFVRQLAPANYRDNSATLGIVGIADAGTRLAARFVNVPANVRIFVSTQSIGMTGGVPDAVMVNTDAAGASTFATVGGAASSIIPVFGPTSLTCTSTYSAIEVPLTSGAGIAVWEVQNSNQSAIDTVVFPAGWAYRANVQAGQPALGTAQVIGNLAPFYGPGAAERMSSGLPIPRFAARSDASNIFRINQCVTNLLFPYVTNWSNFDTGIAIANTSQDPFGSPADRLQSGRCTINYYGRLANGNPPTTTREETDREVGAGETLTFILSGGGTYGLKGNANFQGYIIAQCGFLYAHGFAFITDGPIGQARVAEGYLALVLDGADAGRLRGTNLGEVRGH